MQYITLTHASYESREVDPITTMPHVKVLNTNTPKISTPESEKSTCSVEQTTVP